MKINIIPEILLMLAMVAGTCHRTSAQNYTKDVDVTVELNPEVRAASRLDVSPMLQIKKFEFSSLPSNGRAIPATVTPMITPLSAPGSQANYTSPKTRGYLSGGYFYSEDYGITAGYRVVSNQTTRVDVWSQLNHGTTSGKPMKVYNQPEDMSMVLGSTNWSIGGNVVNTTKAGQLEAKASYTLTRYNYPDFMVEPLKQGINRVIINAGWSSPAASSSPWSYSVKAGMEEFGYTRRIVPTGYVSVSDSNKALNELVANINASGSYSISSGMSIGVSLGYKTAMTNNLQDLDFDSKRSYLLDSKNFGILTAGAKFSFSSSNFSGYVGGQADITNGSGDGTFFGANGLLNWKPSGYFRLSAEFNSGSKLNTVSDLYEMSRFILPYGFKGISHVDGDAALSMKIGSFYGVSFTAKGGFAKASNWMSPIIAQDMSLAMGCDLQSVYYGLRLDYDGGYRVSGYASYEGALSDEPGHAYYRWDDRASNVANIGVLWHPIDALTLGAEYEWRMGRKVCVLERVTSPFEGDRVAYDYFALKSLGRIGHVNLTANYNINDYLSVFARVTGFWQGKYNTISGTPGSRRAGLVGVTFRF